MSLRETVSSLEIAILVMACVIMAISGGLIIFYIWIRSNSRRKGINGIVRRLQRGNIRNEIWRLWKATGFAAIAVMNMTVPPPVREGNTVVAYWSGVIILSFLVVGLIGSIWDALDLFYNWAEALEEGGH